MNKQTNQKLFIAFLCFIFSIKTSAESYNNTPNSIKDSVEFTLQYHKETGLEVKKNIASKKFIPLPVNNNLGIKNGKYWFKLKVEKNNENLIAFIPTHNINKIDIYQLINNKLHYISSTGNSLSLNEIPVSYKFPAFKIPLNDSEKSILYLKVDFPKEANFPLMIVKEKSFIPYIMDKKTINSFYYGTCIVIILLNLFFYMKFRDKNHLFYLLFLTSLMTLFLIFDGSLINIFRGNSFYYYLEYFVHVFCELCFILFSINYLNLHKKHSGYIKSFLLFPIIILILHLTYSIKYTYNLSTTGNVIEIILLPFLWLYGIYYIKQVPYAKLYVFGYLLLISFSFFFIIGFPFGLWKFNGEMLIIKIASWLDMIVFTYAISLKIKNKKEESERRILELQNNLQKLTFDTSLTKQTRLEDNFFTLLKENKLGISPLTLRELDTLKEICKGLSNSEISNKLFISKNTVKYHVKNIYTKAKVNNRTELKEKTLSLKTT